jgi:hypothetical protein
MMMMMMIMIFFLRSFCVLFFSFVLTKSSMSSHHPMVEPIYSTSIRFEVFMVENIQIVFFWVMASHSLGDTNVLKESGRPYMISREIWVTEVRKSQSEPVTRRQRVQTGQQEQYILRSTTTPEQGSN